MIARAVSKRIRFRSSLGPLSLRRDSRNRREDANRVLERRRRITSARCRLSIKVNHFRMAYESSAHRALMQ